MSGIKTERVGARVYVSGDTYPIKDQLKAIGCHPEKGEDGRWRWWIGAAKKSSLDAILVVAARGDSPVSAAEAELAGCGPGVIAGALESESRTEITPEKPREDPGKIRLTGKGEYKGRTYYVGAYTKDGSRCRLLTLPDQDGKYLDFWANVSLVRVTKSYEPRERSYGYGRYHRTEYTTLGSIADFVRRQSDPETRRGRCTECDAWGSVGHTCTECHEGTYV